MRRTKTKPLSIFNNFEIIKKSVESPGTEIPSELRHATIEEFTKWMLRDTRNEKNKN
jgi:hypothetical protein